MHLLRLEAQDGPVYIRPDNIAMISKIDDATSSIHVRSLSGLVLDLVIPVDADEIAQMIERATPGCQIHHAI